MKVWLNGKLVDKKNAKLSVFDHGTLYGDGIFEGIRAYSGKVFQGQSHIDRLYSSAAHIRLAIPYTKQELLEAVRQTIRANNLTDCYIRLVITRGEGPLGLNPFKCATPNVYCIADQIELYPPAMYVQGMPVIIAKTIRTSPKMLNPVVKSLNYLNNILAKIECVDAGVSEAIMLNEHGDVAEASADNVFIVKDGAVITPPAEAGILMGVTRGVVIRLAGRLGIALTERNFKPDELYTADECFLTGTGAEVIAVTRIDDKMVGRGEVGPVTRRLIDAFHQFIRSSEAEG